MVNSMSIYFQLFLASFFWGSNVIVMKLLLNQLPFLFLAFLRVLLSFLFLGLYICFTHIPLHCPNKKKLIIIPAYTESASIERTVRDIMEHAEGFDYVVINDCSTDRTGEILEQFEKRDSRIRVCTNEKNMKLPASLNRAAASSRGARDRERPARGLIMNIRVFAIAARYLDIKNG